MRTIHVDQRKWPDTPHWHFDAKHLGDDDHGTWAFVAADTVIQRGTEPERRSGAAILMLFPPDSPWMIEFYRAHPTHTTYVNIGTVPIWKGDRVSHIDLDLDVIRTIDGTVRILDRDEFEEHRVTLAYPEDLLHLAERATNDAVDLMNRNVPPFDDTPMQWWELAGTGM